VGPIRIEAKDLPKGWSCPPTAIGEGMQATAVVLFHGREQKEITSEAQRSAEKIASFSSALLCASAVSPSFALATAGGPQPQKPPHAGANLIAHATIDGKEPTHELPLPPLESAKPGELAANTVEGEATLAPGGTTKLTVRIDRRKFDKRVPVDIRGLPYG